MLNNIFFLNNNTIILLLIIIICIIIAIFLIILSGLFYVKKDYAAVFEKMYSFYAVKGKGIYFFTPFFIRRVGYYSLEANHIKINLKNFDVFIKYKIEDVKKFHYSGHCFNEVISEELRKIDDNFENLINTTAEKYGIKIMLIKIKKH